MEKTKTVVSIGGKEYTICGTDSAEYIHRVALHVNKKLTELKKANPDLNNIQLAMLTSLNIADDYMKTSDELAAAKKELESKQKELERLEKGQGAGNRTAPFNKR
ncbi:cell division protein ZapA [Christensenella tenuis]|jgi:cell division protein ZapA|uniref:Cell division protein ZapA n=1 Tax=Christensenella tenuis TaxID=2763033 RepID=A0ABR7EIS8_9FIRM|nr:cell division protein ZapA [Christensenella tenuis]MBC5649296.1 cell division protein ZapA [Christensenella tenuis]